jgi:3-oxoadipate CoA-transferase, beta subunit
VLTRQQIAWRVAQEIPDGSYVNLGLGMPVLVSDHVPATRDVFFQSENGVLGMGAVVSDEDADWDLIDAGSRAIKLRSGGCVVDSLGAFGMIRGGHIDITVLGGFEVSAEGDLANWTLGGPEDAPLVGGAMDLASSAKSTWVMMSHNARNGSPRLLKECALPLTGRRCVAKVFTDIAVIDVSESRFVAVELLSGVSIDELRMKTGAPVTVDDRCKVLQLPPARAVMV